MANKRLSFQIDNDGFDTLEHLLKSIIWEFSRFKKHVNKLSDFDNREYLELPISLMKGNSDRIAILLVDISNC